MTLVNILSVAVGVLAGAAGVLALVAPRTSNTVDDKILALTLKVEELAKSLLPK